MAQLCSILIISLAFATILGGAGARAAEVADGGRSETVRVSASSGRLGQSDAARLVRGELATLSRLDRKYKEPRTLDICKETWNELRQTPVRMVPVRAGVVATMRANARRFGISRAKLDNALATFLKNQHELPNQRYISIVDFDKPTAQKRMFTINLETGGIEGFFTSAGYGSDPRESGYATHFSNKVDQSNASSLGCYVMNGEYRSVTKRRRLSLVLHGIDSSNDNACQRNIIVHHANYVGNGLGRSEGCLAVRRENLATINERLNGGGLICAYREGPKFQAAGHYKKKNRARHARRQHHHRSRHAERSYAND